MKLHIIMVVLNNLDLTKQAISSITTRYSYALHVMDQNSTDGTEEWAKHNPAVLYKRFSPQVALSEAWNLAIREALLDPECEYIFVPNNDVIFHTATIDALIEGIDTLGYAMVTGDNVCPKLSLEEFRQLQNPGDTDHDSRPITNWREEGPDFSCFMIKRDFVEKVGYFDENFYPAYFEDNDCHIRILKAGLHAKRLSKAPYYHLASQTIRNNPQLQPIISDGFRKNQSYFILKWGAMPADVMDGQGYSAPYNEAEKSWKHWRGADKYE